MIRTSQSRREMSVGLRGSKGFCADKILHHRPGCEFLSGFETSLICYKLLQGHTLSWITQWMENAEETERRWLLISMENHKYKFRLA